MSHRQEGRWGTTQETAWSLIAFLRFAASVPGAPRTAWAVTAGVLYAMPLYTLMFFFGQSDAILLALALASERLAAFIPDGMRSAIILNSVDSKRLITKISDA